MSENTNNSTTQTFRPAGELTIYTAAEGKVRLLETLADCAALEVDVSQLSEVDTAGVQLLILARMEALRRNIPFRLFGASAAVRAVIELCNLGALFDEPPGVPYEHLARRHAS